MKRTNFLLILILVFALVVRLWGINYGLPLTLHMDENVNFGMGIYMVSNHSFNPAPTQWGFVRSSFIFNFFAVLTYIRILWDKFFQIKETIANLNLPAIVIAGRFFIASLSAFVVYLCYVITKKLFDIKTSLFSAFVLSTTFIHVLVSHYGTSDIPQGFFNLVAFYFLYQIVRTGKLKYYLFSGLFIGFATSANYHAAVSALNLIIAHFLHLASFPINPKRLKNNFRYLITGLFSIGVGFVLFTPYSLIEIKRFLSDINFMRNMYRTGQNGVFGSSLNGISTPIWWILYLFTSGLGPTYLFLFFIGVVVCLIKPNKTNIFLLSFPVIWFMFMSTNIVRFDRHITPILPMMAMIISLAFWRLVESIRRKKLITILLAALIFIPPTVKVITFDYLIAQKDTRLLAIEWAVKNLNKNSLIFSAGSAIPVGQKLYSLGYKNVVDVISNEPEKMFSHPGAILIIGDDSYRLAKLYRNISPYTQAWNFSNTIYQKAKLIKIIDQSLFQREFFGPFYLEHSSTVNIYHNPAILFFEIPRIEKYLDGKANSDPGKQ